MMREEDANRYEATAAILAEGQWARCGDARLLLVDGWGGGDWSLRRFIAGSLFGDFGSAAACMAGVAADGENFAARTGRDFQIAGGMS